MPAGDKPPPYVGNWANTYAPIHSLAEEEGVVADSIATAGGEGPGEGAATACSIRSRMVRGSTLMDRRLIVVTVVRDAADGETARATA